jgi:hypothetical protein
MTLKPSERSAICVAWVSLPAVWCLLKFFRLDRVQAWLLPVANTIEPASSREWTALPNCVRIASRFALCPTTCLSRSLVLCRMLRRQGVNCELRIGVRIVEGVFTAHAWIEVEGRPLDGDHALHHFYLPFEDFELQRAKFR